MSEQETTEATVLVGMRTREEVLGLPEDVTFLQSLRPWQVKAKADAQVPVHEQEEVRPGE